MNDPSFNHGKKLLLLVEDDPDHQALALRSLRREEVEDEVVVMGDGTEALGYLASADPLPDVVLLDLKLGRLDGLEVLRRMRAEERTRHVPVVVLTSSTEQRDLERAYQLGANSYVQKPVDFLAFRELVGWIGRYWLRHNLLPNDGKHHP